MKYKIFLVEDDKHFAYVLKSFLTTKGYDVDWYENGEIALEKYKNNPEHVKVSALCKQIRIDRQAIDYEF